MNRINEEESANAFIEKLSNGYYKYDRSQNTEVDYAKEKEERDTNAVKQFLNSKLFCSLKQIK